MMRRKIYPSFWQACAIAVWPQTGDLAPVVAKPVSQNDRFAGRDRAVPERLASRQSAGVCRSRPGGPRQRRQAGAICWSNSALRKWRRESRKRNRKLQAAEANRLQAEAQLAAAQSTYDRLKKAAETPGAIAGNELVQARKTSGRRQGCCSLPASRQAGRRKPRSVL